ncbi:hypothetical protein QTP86_018570 [Hemibagrus guttatus]|nr:hypothetical protein QTP86_018570 [Hemibagrus guttatus]
MQESPGSIGVDGGYANNVPAFLTKLWTLVEDPETNHLICWSSTGTSFHVFDQGRFAKEVLPKYFKHNNMASFVRQLNMYGFRKVVNIEQSGLVKPERDDTEFQHLYFLQGHEHLLEHIKRKVSIVKSEETKFRQEDLSKLLYEVQVLRSQQENMECQMQDMKQQNEVLWREVMSLRQNHTHQQKVMNKLIQFLVSQMQVSPPSSVGMKRKLPLMLDDGSTTPPTSKLSHSHSMESIQEAFYIQSPSTESVSCSTSNTMTVGPIISDVTDMSQPSAMAIQMEEARPETSEAVENVDMSFEELQLLLRNHQHSIESSSASVDTFTFSMPMNEWNFTEMDPNLKSELANILVPAAMSQYMFQCQEGEVCNTNGCEEQAPNDIGSLEY